MLCRWQQPVKGTGQSQWRQAEQGEWQPGRQVIAGEWFDAAIEDGQAQLAFGVGSGFGRDVDASPAERIGCGGPEQMVVAHLRYGADRQIDASGRRQQQRDLAAGRGGGADAQHGRRGVERQDKCSALFAPAEIAGRVLFDAIEMFQQRRVGGRANICRDWPGLAVE